MQSSSQSFFNVVLVTVMAALQSVLSHYVPNAAALFNLPLLALLYVTLTQSSLPLILFLGTLAGFLQDAQTVDLLGLNGFSNLSVCSLLYLSSAVIAVEGWVMRSSVLWLSFILSSLISIGLRIAFLNRHESLYFDQLLMGAFVCAFVGLPVFALWDKLSKVVTSGKMAGGGDVLVNVTKGLLRK